MLKPGLKLFALCLFVSQFMACQTSPTATPKPGIKEAPVAAENDPSQSLYQAAIGSARNEQIDTAIKQFQQLIAQNPAFNQAYTNLGLLLLQKKQVAQAKIAFESAIDQDKSDAVAYNHLAIIQREEGLFKQALGNYRKAIDSRSDYANAYLNLGILLDIYLQDLPEALKQYRIYQKMTNDNNKNVGKWVIDLERRVKAQQKNPKG